MTSHERIAQLACERQILVQICENYDDATFAPVADDADADTAAADGDDDDDDKSDAAAAVTRR